MGRSAIEAVMGAVVLLVALGFVGLAYETAELKTVQGYPVSAVFTKIGGLSKGSDVRINGIKVGSVIGHALDPDTFEAVVNMTIRSDLVLPADTVAAIAGEGIMGDKFVRLEPGQAKERLAEGGVIVNTKDFRSLEDQVGEIIFLASGGD